VSRDNGVPAQHPGFTVVPVAAMLWAVYDPRIRTDAAVGHIECFDGRFRIALEGAEFELYVLATLGLAELWFVEFCFALTVGTSRAVASV
jgi:hypothetical protein